MMTPDQFRTNAGRISQDELRDLFGEAMPCSVVELLMRENWPITDIRAKIANIATMECPSPSPVAVGTGPEVVAANQDVAANAPGRMLIVQDDGEVFEIDVAAFGEGFISVSFAHESAEKSTCLPRLTADEAYALAAWLERAARWVEDQ